MTLRADISSPIPVEFIQKQGQDQSNEANMALMELEKGLRSNKSGEQCEAIVHVPALLEKYPYPILVNSAFLKLADVFRSGSNFMKLCVLKAIQSSRRHLEKIFNVDEFCRRFFAVIHSNDPIARAITLRVFGNISSIIAERKNVHHSIRNSLESHDISEVEAAIFATKSFAEQSSSFATGLFQKVADMIEGLSTPIEMKLKLLPVFRFMYHDVDIARQVNVVCSNLLLSYPSHMFVAAILNTGTQLAVATLINIEEQVNLLLKYLTDDPRKSIKMIAIKNLLILAKRAPHLWRADNVDKLVSVGAECIHSNVRQKILHVVRILAVSESCTDIFSEQVLEKLDDLCNDTCVETSTLALQAIIRVTCTRQDLPDTDTMSSLELHLQMMFAISVAENSLISLKRCLSSAEELLRKSADDESSLIDFLVNSSSGLEGEFLLEVCHSLVTLSTYQRRLCSAYTANLMTLFKKQVCLSNSKLEKDIIVAVFTIILQSSCKEEVVKKVDLQEELLQHASILHTKQEFWVLYKMARQSSRLGYPLFVSRTVNLLTTKVSSESLYFWLKSLVSFQDGEAVLMSDVDSIAKLQELLMASHNHYQEGLTNLKAAVTTDHPLYFQFKFARLRSDILRAYSQLLTCCSSLRMNPPPALARSTSMATGQEVHHLSRLANQFQHCTLLFTNAAIGYQNLFKASFNADPTTLQYIQLLQEDCQLISSAIETLVLSRFNERVSPEFSPRNHTEKLSEYFQTITNTNLEIIQKVQNIDAETKDSPLSHHQIDFLASIVLSHLSIGFSFPMYFFKSLQNSSLQLSISPGNAMADNPYLVNIAHNMALKIEGVVIEKRNAVRFRHTDKVNLLVKVKPSDNVRNVANEVKPVQLTETVFKEIAKPRKDYFSAEFLLSFKYLGHHSIKITAGICDEAGIDWETGPSFVIHVEVHEQGHMKRR